MGRAPCCDKAKVKKGPWSPEEDAKLKSHIQLHGTGGNWIALPTKIGLKRCGKSCRLRWLNYLRPNIKHGAFTQDEDNLICSLYLSIGTRWSVIAGQLPGRTDNDIKNYWNTKLKKKLFFANQRTTSSSSSSPLSDHHHHHHPPLPLNTNTIMPPPLPHLQQPTAFCYSNNTHNNFMEEAAAAAAADFHCAQLWENSGVDLVSSQQPIATTTSSSSSMENLSWEEINYYTNYPLFHHDPTLLPYSQ